MSGDDSGGWQLTESDPAVFSELLKTLGLPFIVDDLYALDDDSLASLQPLHALIFLFKWVPQSPDHTPAGKYDPDFAGFFAHQVVNNACATLAVLNALGNIPSLKCGEQLQDLFSFTAGMDADTRGEVITSSDWLREAHNSLSPPSAISLDGLGLPKKTEEAYHFVVYLPVLGSLYELDGLKPHAISHGAFDDAKGGWLARAREVIEGRIATYPPGALDFSLLALRDDPLPGMHSELRTLQSLEKESDATELVMRIANETNKRERWAFENSLRRHNHVGLMHALLVALAKSGKLGPAKETAKKVMQDRIHKAKERGEAMDEN
ncbi:ubiquitin carboxyl-terminal hydrolase isozyme l5 [Moniliophthora roreri MCA 2997]|uniref:Ubiquitin carboxyl-terminal hydrolase n=1 Tax=Moniliophthora roreri (strain MCA 2997) TaxID=1381753 RepID=V2YH23_MONRO|nr:ubiquitin carboxyl-terminal hydrolase isozyme l5 [Moniliophthora roreri MCA 2997]